MPDEKPEGEQPEKKDDQHNDYKERINAIKLESQIIYGYLRNVQPEDFVDQILYNYAQSRFGDDTEMLMEKVNDEAVRFAISKYLHELDRHWVDSMTGSLGEEDN